jgi:hypothetical protein
MKGCFAIPGEARHNVFAGAGRFRGPWGARALLLGFTVFTVSLSADPAAALPRGRSWAPTRVVVVPGVVRVRAPRMEVDSVGSPLLIIGAHRIGAADKEWAVFAWHDSLWTPSHFTGVRASFFPEPVLSLVPGQYLTWLSTVEFPNGLGPVLFCRLLPAQTAVETVLTTFVQDSEYGAAVSHGRRWVVRSQQRPGTFTNWVRTLYSDTVGIWRELPEQGVNDLMCTIAPLSDRSAIVAYSDSPGLNWAIVDGERWVANGVLDPGLLGPPLHPRFRFRPSGGLWLMWTNRRAVHVSSFRDGVWDRGDSVTCVHPPGETFYSAWSDMSRDPRERPVLAWGDLGVGQTFHDIGCVAFPTDSGWAPGEEIPGSRGLFLTPKVTRDRNGDVWLVWDMRGQDITRYTHTYVSATASTPAIAGAGRRRTLQWTLSESAPGSWWTVLRSRRGGAFDEVARVEAGEGTAMSWTDDSPPAGPLRYRIRRESVNTAYLWESGEVAWPPSGRKPLRLAMAPAMGQDSGSGREVRLELADAEPGEVEIAMYDLQGRLVLRERGSSAGLGTDVLHLDLVNARRPVTQGLYFVIARDAGSRRSDAAKVVVLK